MEPQEQTSKRGVKLYGFQGGGEALSVPEQSCPLVFVRHNTTLNTAQHTAMLISLWLDTESRRHEVPIIIVSEPGSNDWCRFRNKNGDRVLSNSFSAVL